MAARRTSSPSSRVHVTLARSDALTLMDQGRGRRRPDLSRGLALEGRAGADPLGSVSCHAPAGAGCKAARSRRLHDVVAALRERYGPHIIRTGAEFAGLRPTLGHHPLTTGSLGLDLIAGGLPRGSIVEYAGVDGTGKESLALTALAACQEAGGVALLVDADGANDPDALDAAEVDLERLVLACPTTAAEGWAILVALARCGALDLVVLLSFPGLLLLPDAGWSPGRRLRGLARLAIALHGSPTVVLLTNHPLAPHPARDPDSWETVGGQAMAQAARLRVALRQAGVRFTPYGDVEALRTVATVVKHHGIAHGDPVTLEIGPSGPSRAAELVALGRRATILQQTPLGLALDERVLGRTDIRAAAFLQAHPETAARLEGRIRASWVLPSRRAAPEMV